MNGTTFSDATNTTTATPKQAQETPAFQFSVLTCKKNLLLTKTILADGNDIPYDNPKHFQFGYCEANTIEEFVKVLGWLADQPHKCIIRGQLKAGLSGWQQRLLRDRSDSPATVECPPRRLIIFDLDGVNVPHGMGDPGALAETGYHIRDTLLPKIFQQVKCVASATASTGRKGPGVARLRMFFALSDPAATEPLYQKIESIRREYPYLNLDPACMRPHQIIYTARPRFIGTEGDPVPMGRRVVVLDGVAGQVPTSWFGVDDYKPKKPFKPAVYNGDKDGGEAWSVIRWAFEKLDGCPKGGEGRFETLRKVAWRMANAVKEGKISEVLARDAYLAAAEGINNYDKKYDDNKVKGYLDAAFADVGR